MFNIRLSRGVPLFLRMIIGIGLMLWGTKRLTRGPYKKSYVLLTLLGAMNIGESFFHYLLFNELNHGLNNLHNKPELKKIIDIVVPEDHTEEWTPGFDQKT